MKRIALILSILLLAASAPRPASAQEGRGITFSSDAVEIGIGGRIQTQFNTTSVVTEAPSELFLRRVRLELDVKLNDLVSGALQPDFAGNEVTLKDVYLKLNFSPAIQILTGQAYIPFSLVEQTSSTRILPIERGARVRGLEALDEYELVNGLDYSDRDIGVQVMGAPAFMPLGFAYQAGVFRGPLHGASTVDDSYQYAARVTLEPIDVVRIGGGWSSRHFLAVPGNTADPFLRGHAFEVDLEVGTFAPGLHLLGEVAFGDADPNVGRDFFGTQGWVAWRSGRLSRAVSAVEPIFRASYGDPGEGFARATLLTPGFNVHFGGRNRVMVNYDFVLPDTDFDPDADTEGAFRAQFQLAF